MSRFTKLLIWLSPRKIFIPTQKKLEKKWMGSAYAGFFVHLPALSKESTVLSFGVGEDISFDIELLKRKNLQIYTFDPTRGVDKFIEPYLKQYSGLSFVPVGLSSKDGEELFYPPEDVNHVSCSVVANNNTKENAYKVQMQTLSSIIKANNIGDIDLLKIDIEGSEYDVIPDILDKGIKVKQILMEIHPDHFADGKKKTRDLIRKLNQHGYKIFGVSDTCREISLIQ